MSRRKGFIHPSAVIGEPAEMRENEPESGVVINPQATIEALCTIDAGTNADTWIGDAWIMKGCHIGHDVFVYHGVEMAPHCVIGGFATIYYGAKLGLNVTVLPKVKIGVGARIGAGAVVTKDVPAGEVWVGVPAHKIHLARALPDDDPNPQMVSDPEA